MPSGHLPPAEDRHKSSRRLESWTGAPPMSTQPNSDEPKPTVEPLLAGPETQRSWSARYGAIHRLARLTEFPSGIAAPRKVRVYRRVHHYVLQWWDPAAKRTLSDRVDGDLLSALIRARQIDERLIE